MKTPMTPLEFYAPRPQALPGSRGRRRWRSSPDLRAILCALRPLVGRAATRLGVARATVSPTSRPTRMPNSNPSMPCRRSAPCWFRSTTGSPPTISPISSTTAAPRWSARTPTISTRSSASAPQLPGVAHFVALGGRARGLAGLRDAAGRDACRASRPEISEDDLLTINYTSGTTSRPKGVMITHRNAYMNTVGTLIHFHMTPADRYLWTLPMFHANGWTFVWTVTAVGGHAHLPAQGRAGAHLRADRRRSTVTMLCAAPTVLISIANAPEETAARIARAVFAFSPPARRPPRPPSSASKASSAGRSPRSTA